MKKVEKLQKNLAETKKRREELAVLSAPILKQLQPIQTEDGNLYDQQIKIEKEIKSLTFEPSLEYILSHTHDHFPWDENPKKCTYRKMGSYMSHNFKYLRISGYNTKTNIYAIELMLLTGASVNDMVAEITPVIDLAIKSGQENFGMFTDDLSEAGVLQLEIKGNKYKLGITRHSRYSEIKSFHTLREFVEYAVANKMTYKR